jgi:hypothetical protein
MIDFLNENPSFVSNQLCVDLGCGTGVHMIGLIHFSSNNSGCWYLCGDFRIQTSDLM